MPVPLHELAYRASLDTDTGPDEGHLVGQVQQGAGLEALPHFELGRGLEQEDPFGAALVYHVVYARVFRVYPAQLRSPVLLLFDEVEGFL